MTTRSLSPSRRRETTARWQNPAFGKSSLELGALRLGRRQGASFAAEPFARGGLGLGAILRAEACERLVQDGVTLAGAFRQQMPFETLDLVHRGALSAQQDMRK